VTRVLVAIALASACTNLPDRATGVCGNGVLEPGEDCDGGSNCDRCRYRCDPDHTCGTIPSPRDGSAYACGVDGYCHAPGGALAAESANVSFPVFGFGITDVDKDHYSDVVGLSGSSLLSRFGDATGAMQRETATLSPQLWGEPFVIDLDGDKALDIVLPTTDGIAAYASPAGIESPYALGFGLGPGGAGLTTLFTLDGIRVVIVGELMGRFGAYALDPRFSPEPTFAGSMCGVNDLDPHTLAVYRNANGAKATVTVSFVMPGSTSQLCTASLAVSQGTNIYSPLWSMPTPVLPTTAITTSTPTVAIFADVAGDSCPELVFRNDAGALGPELAYYTSSLSVPDSTCQFTFSSAPTRLATIAASPALFDALVGHVPMLPKGAPGHHDAIVTTYGIYDPAIAGFMMNPIYVGDRPLTQSDFGDFDGDGLFDVVGARNDGFTPDQNLDVLYHHFDPSSGTNTFLRTRIPTATVPVAFVVGDFDGDGLSDILFGDSFGGGQQLGVAYGSRDRQPVIATVAETSSILALSTGVLHDSGNLLDVIQSLAVIEKRLDVRTGTSSEVIELFHGSAQRTLIPYLDDRRCPPASSRYAGIVGGHFSSASTTALDFIAFEDYPLPGGCAGDRAWLFVGNGVGTFQHTSNAMMPSPSGFVDVGAAIGCTTPSTLCPSSSQFTAFPDPASRLDVVIGIDWASGRVVVLDPGANAAAFMNMTAPGPIPISSLPAPRGFPAGGGAPVRMNAPFLADTDGDGVVELIVAFDGAPAGAAMQSDVLRCDVSLQSSPPLACNSLSSYAAELPIGCADATTGKLALLGQDRAQPSPTSVDVIARCPGSTPGTSEIWRVYHDASGYHATRVAELAFVPVQLVLGDLTGDGVPDVAALDSAGMLHVFPQLTSTELPKQ
jgi:hypothetical protein